MYPKYQSVKFNPAFEVFFDNEEALINVCNAALSLSDNQKITAATYKKCDVDEMLQGNPFDFFFSIEATLQNGTKLHIALHKKSIISRIDKEILISEPTDKPFPYKTVFGPGDLYFNYPRHYDYVIWFSFVKPSNIHLSKSENLESEWDEWGRKYSKSTTTQYIYYEIESFSKNPIDLKNDEDRWLYLLKNSSNSEEDCPFKDSIFDHALSRITSAKLTMEFAERQKNAMFCQMDYLYRLDAAQKSGYAEGRAEALFKKILSQISIPISTNRDNLPKFIHQIVAVFMYDSGVDPFYIARNTNLSESEIKELQGTIHKLRNQN